MTIDPRAPNGMFGAILLARGIPTADHRFFTSVTATSYCAGRAKPFFMGSVGEIRNSWGHFSGECGATASSGTIFIPEVRGIRRIETDCFIPRHDGRGGLTSCMAIPDVPIQDPPRWEHTERRVLRQHWSCPAVGIPSGFRVLDRDGGRSSTCTGVPRTWTTDIRPAPNRAHIERGAACASKAPLCGGDPPPCVPRTIKLIEEGDCGGVDKWECIPGVEGDGSCLWSCVGVPTETPVEDCPPCIPHRLSDSGPPYWSDCPNRICLIGQICIPGSGDCPEAECPPSVFSRSLSNDECPEPQPSCSPCIDRIWGPPGDPFKDGDGVCKVREMCIEGSPGEDGGCDWDCDEPHRDTPVPDEDCDDPTPPPCECPSNKPHSCPTAGVDGCEWVDDHPEAGCKTPKLCRPDLPPPPANVRPTGRTAARPRGWTAANGSTIIRRRAANPRSCAGPRIANALPTCPFPAGSAPWAARPSPTAPPDAASPSAAGRRAVNPAASPTGAGRGIRPTGTRPAPAWSIGTARTGRGPAPTARMTAHGNARSPPKPGPPPGSAAAPAWSAP